MPGTLNFVKNIDCIVNKIIKSGDVIIIYFTYYVKL